MNTELLEEARSHFNEPILILFDLARCIGYAEDEDDCYLLVRYPRPRNGLTKHTFVGGYCYLGCLKNEGQITLATGEPCDDFVRLDSLLALNGAPKEPSFIVDVAD